MKILLRAPLGIYTGYGQDGVGLVESLMDRGHDVRVMPTSVEPPLPMSVLGALKSPVHGETFDLSITHVPPVRPPVLAHKARMNVFWSMWEWEPQGMDFEAFKRNNSVDLSAYDHVVAYDANSKKVLEGLSGKEVSVVQGGFRADEWEISPSLTDSPLTFGMVGALGLRKNPWVTLKAFRMLREAEPTFDARLMLKTSVPVVPSGWNDPNIIEIVDPGFTPEAMKVLYGSIDVLLAPSWGEGKNLPALEAAATGCDLMLSDCAGHAQWADWSMITKLPSVSMAYRGDLVGRYVSADTLANHMLHAWNRRTQLKRRNEVLSNFVKSSMGWPKAVERLGFKIGVPL